ncbi:MAG TPA: hypothetical protein VF807_10695 [Ktedonobacterales bacterium]
MRSLSRSRVALSLTCALGALIALGGCALPAIGAKPTPTPITAKGILLGASNAKYTDVTFTLTFDSAIQGIAIKGTGTGVATSNPKRFEMTLDLPITVAGQSFDTQQHIITDEATSKTYTQTTTNGQAEAWKVTATDTSSGSDYSSLLGSSTGIDAPVLAGEDTVNGVMCYHITGTSNSTPVEAWVSKSDLRLQKVTATVTSSGTTATIVFLITGYDTGKTITLPTV